MPLFQCIKVWQYVCIKRTFPLHWSNFGIFERRNSSIKTLLKVFLLHVLSSCNISLFPIISFVFKHSKVLQCIKLTENLIQWWDTECWPSTYKLTETSLCVVFLWNVCGIFLSQQELRLCEGITIAMQYTFNFFLRTCICRHANENRNIWGGGKWHLELHALINIKRDISCVFIYHYYHIW